MTHRGDNVSTSLPPCLSVSLRGFLCIDSTIHRLDPSLTSFPSEPEVSGSLNFGLVSPNVV